MGIDLRWEDEDGEILGFVDDSKNHFKNFLASIKLNDTIILKFIDHYGDTTLNQKQTDQFIKELKPRITEIKSINEKEQLLEILKPAQKSHGKTHTYHKFYGD